MEKTVVDIYSTATPLELQQCIYLAKRIYNPHVLIILQLHILHQKQLNDTIAQLPWGHAHSLNKRRQVAVVVNQEYVGGYDQFLTYCINKYATIDKTPKAVLKSMKNELLISIYNSNKEKEYVYMDFQHDSIKSRVLFELHTKLAPKTCENFKLLCIGENKNKDGELLTYKGASISRIIQDGFIQGGRLKCKGHKTIYNEPIGDEGYAVKHNEAGVLGICRNEDDEQCDQSEFYVTLAPLPKLNNKQVAFGRVIDGMESILELSKVQVNYGEPSHPITITDCGLYRPVVRKSKEEKDKKMLMKTISNKEEKLKGFPIFGSHRFNYSATENTFEKPTQRSEVLFYKAINETPSTHPQYNEYSHLLKFIPKLITAEANDKVSKVVLERVGRGMKNPSLMDIKIGKLTTLPNDPPIKIEKQMALQNCCIQGSLGFRFIGYSIIDKKGKTLENVTFSSKSNFENPLKTLDDAIEVLDNFLTINKTEPIYLEAIDYYIKYISELKHYIETESSKAFVNSSLLFAFSASDKKYDVKMIDFVDAVPSQSLYWGKDDNIIMGLTNIIKALYGIKTSYESITEDKCSEPSTLKLGDEKEIKLTLFSSRSKEFKVTNKVIVKPVGKREYQFYQCMSNKDNGSIYRSENKALYPFISEVYSTENADNKYKIALERIGYGAKSPSIMDVKIGVDTVPPKASQEKQKKNQELKDNTLQGSHGFRVRGYSVFNKKGEEEANVHFSADFYKESKLSTEAHGLSLLQEFFTQNQTIEIYKHAIEFYIERIEKIIHFMETESTRAFIGGSLLFMYDPFGKAKDLRIINFHYVTPLIELNWKKDENFIKGCKNLVKLLKKL